MGKQKLKGKELRKIGFRSDQAKSLAINIMSGAYKHKTKEEKLDILKEVLIRPDDFLEDEILAPLAELFAEKVEKENFTVYQLREEPKKYMVHGKQFIDRNTIKQMDLVSQLPVVQNVALMPDAHVGYGVPIGGVIATKNEVIPYAVGVDIGCRMALTIFDATPEYLNRYRYQLKQALKEETHFGLAKANERREEHEVLDRSEFRETDLLRQLHGKAAIQLGTSGGGNHFVEFGVVELTEGNELELPAGNYLGLLSHSGSRGLGATIANYYKQVAMDVCRLPRTAQQLAWLDLDKEEGIEYWMAMNLAGDYAKACHDVIHWRLAKTLGLKSLKKVENHHNFAWKEVNEKGEEFIVHRKGATPAKKGEFGIIPGSMTEPGFIVSGKGNPGSINSASHGAGRQWSRKKARESITKSALRNELKNKGVTLIGGGVDEAPIAYKRIEDVIAAQTELVDVHGKFYPKIVRMCKD